MSRNDRGSHDDVAPQHVRRRMDVEERKTAILNAAREAFTGGSYSDVSVATIARRAATSQALIFHYFGSKAQLYAEVVRSEIEQLAAAQRSAINALGNVSARDRVRETLLVYVAYIAEHPQGWASPLVGGMEPPEAVAVRREARKRYVDALRDLLGVESWPRHEYALWGYFGFLDAACLAWVNAGCPDDDRYPLIDACLGALEGALGDWTR